MTTIVTKNVDDILSFIQERIKSEIKSETGSDYCFYLIYYLPRLQSYSYLLTKESAIALDFDNSFSYHLLSTQNGFEVKSNNEKVSFIKLNFSNGILKKEEINEIINAAFINEEIDLLIKRLDGNKFLQKYYSNKSKLAAILEGFNRIDISFYQQIKNGDNFPIFLRIVLLSLPQLNSQYSVFNDPDKYNSNGKKVNGSEKLKKIESHIFNYENKYSEMSFSDRILLLLTICEGFLWKLETNKSTFHFNDFYVGNLYNTLKQTELLKNNLLFIKPIDYYFYGTFNNEIIFKNKLIKITSKYLPYIIQFSKFYLAQYNFCISNKRNELISPYLPKTIAHGLLGVTHPKSQEIIYKNSKATYSYSDTIEFKTEHLLNPWSFYKENISEQSRDITEPSQESISYDKENRKITINTKNSLDEDVKIVLNYDWDDQQKLFKDESTHFLGNFDNYKYTLKGFIDKLLYISRSTSYNSNTSTWYNKAFCKLYKLADEKRHAVDPYKNYRNWENQYFTQLLGSKENVEVIDFGAGYGRLEKVLVERNQLTKVANVYAIDLSNTLLNLFITENNTETSKIKTIHCDFQTIDLLFDPVSIDFAFFIYTTFGYLKKDEENEEVLVKAYNLLKPGGKLIIEQFNPNVKPDHCKSENPEQYSIFEFEDETNEENLKRNYKLLKTSNFDEPEKTGANFALYYGNYVYFDTTGNTEEMVKCDAYEIRLYTDKWFEDIEIDGTKLKENCNFRYFKLDGNDGNEEDSIMIIEITRKITKVDFNKIHDNVYTLLVNIDSAASHSSRLSRIKDQINAKYSESAVEFGYNMLLKILTNVSEDNENKIKKYESLVQ
jgi:SAM-dependent methyltransferase